jgi:coatomer protein complex subunit gamma
MTATEEGLTEDFIIPAESITADAPGIVYVSFTRTAPEEFALSSFECTLKFISKEVDPTTGTPEEEGYDDEYQVEQIDIGAGDVSLGFEEALVSALAI